LTVNDTTCQFFCLNEEDIIGMKLKAFLKKSFHLEFDAMMESLLDDTGNLIVFTESLVEVVLSNGHEKHLFQCPWKN